MISLNWGDCIEDFFITEDGKKIDFQKKTALINSDYYLEASKFKKSIRIVLIQVLYDYSDADYPECKDSVTKVWKVPIAEFSNSWGNIKQEISNIIV